MIEKFRRGVTQQQCIDTIMKHHRGVMVIDGIVIAIQLLVH